MTDLKRMMEIADQHPPTTEERIAALEAELAQIKTGLQEGLLSVCHRLEALEAKPKGNKQGYPSTGVVWDGTRRNMAKAYGFTNADIDTMQEAMDAHHIALKNTPKAKVSSDWQRNVQTWIINQARYDGRTRQDAPGSPQVSDDSPEVTGPHTAAARAALAKVLLTDNPELDACRVRAAYAGIRTDLSAEWRDTAIIRACGGKWLHQSWVDSPEDQKKRSITVWREYIETKAAKLGIPAGAFAWPEI